MFSTPPKSVKAQKRHHAAKLKKRQKHYIQYVRARNIRRNEKKEGARHAYTAVAVLPGGRHRTDMLSILPQDRCRSG